MRRRDEARLERDIRNTLGGPEYPDVLICPNEVGKVLAPGDFISAIASVASQLVMSAGGIIWS